MRDLGDDLNARISSHCLDPSDVGEMEVCKLGEPLLSQAALLT